MYDKNVKCFVKFEVLLLILISSFILFGCKNRGHSAQNVDINTEVTEIDNTLESDKSNANSNNDNSNITHEDKINNLSDKETKEIIYGKDFDIEDAEYSGRCGYTATWYYLNGVMKICGTGEVEKFYKEDINDLDVKWLIIDEGIEKFRGVYDANNDVGFVQNFYKLSIPSTMRNICGFKNCKNLIEVEIAERHKEDINCIDSEAFKGCTSLKNINVPDGILYIGNSAFEGCESLKDIHLPNSIENIKSHAFENCKILENISMPENILSIEKYAFSNCKRLKNINVPDNLEIIGDYAFSDCESLQGFNISDNSQIFRIGEGAFKNCVKLEYISIPKDVTHIQNNVFDGCIRLENIVLPDTVEYIGSSAFAMCVSLKLSRFPKELTEIYDKAFTGCKSLESIELPNHVHCIGSEAFLNCKALKSVITVFTNDDEIAFLNWAKESADKGNYDTYNEYWRTHLEYSCGIEERAFAGCSSLKKVALSNFKEVGAEAFLDCSELEEVSFVGGYTNIRSWMSNIDDMAFKGCSKLKNIQLPDIVVGLGSRVFSQCNCLEYMIIPELNVISEDTFYECENLREIEVKQDDITKGFIRCPNLERVIFPDGTSNAWEKEEAIISRAHE